jgi:SAM-dependent methyltransferase
VLPRPPRGVGFRWPAGFAAIPGDAWVTAPIDGLAAKYDKVEHHGWYSNLDPTVADVAGFLQTGDVLVDYSGGTGIFLDRLLQRTGSLAFGACIVDASPKFLRLALEKFRGDPRVAYRWLRWHKDQKRLDGLDEVLGEAVVKRGVEAISSTNAIHLYTDLGPTLRAWHRCLKRGGRVFVQSGNIRPPLHFGERWIIDDTVEALHKEAVRLVREDPRWAAHRAAVDDARGMAAHAAYRRRVFVPPRSLDHYAAAFWEAGFDIVGLRTEPVEALVEEWHEFLAVYHDAILGWVGGSPKVEGKEPPPQALQERHALLREAMAHAFGGRGSFQAAWTYITCAKRGDGRA